MSGHSKWSSIKHKKGALDAQRGKVFTKHAKLIAIAAKRGSDPDTNPSLRAAMDNAKLDNVPNMNVERAIKKGSGQDKDAVTYEEILYEAFGPGGTALYIQVITDNKNRALADIKSMLTRHGGSMGITGSAARLFERKGLIIVPLKEGANADEVELSLIDAGAQDIKREGSTFEVYTNAGELAKVRDSLKSAGVEFEKATIVFLPVQTVKIEDESTAKRVLGLVNMLDEHDDVSEVYCNFDISDELMERAG